MQIQNNVYKILKNVIGIDFCLTLMLPSYWLLAGIANAISDSDV